MILFYLIQAVRQSGDRNKIGIMEKNKYLLTMMVAERAKQLLAGANPLIKTKFKNPVAIALKEIEEGKVYLKKQKDLEKEDPFKRVLRFRPEEEDQEPGFEFSVLKGGDK